VDVVDQTQERSIRSDQDRLVAALEHMPALVAVAIEPRGKGALQPLHSRHQIRFRRPHRQVVVITHDHIRVYLPPASIHRLQQRLLEPLPSATLREKILPVIPTADHVIDRIFEFQTTFSRHETPSDIDALPSQYLNSTFDPIRSARIGEAKRRGAIKFSQSVLVINMNYEYRPCFGPQRLIMG